MRARGLTLLETLLSISLFFVMLGAVVLCERTIRQAQPRAAATSEVDRMALLAFEKVRTELKGALVVPPADPSQLSFYKPDLVDGEVQVGPTGEAVYSQTLATLFNEGGVLKLADRRIANLGEKGWMRFELQDDLIVTVHAETTVTREFRGRIPLPNQN